MILTKAQEALLKSWMKECTFHYNKCIEILNTNQGFKYLEDKYGKAKGTLALRFKTSYMRNIKGQYDIPAKLIHNICLRAYNAWDCTKKEKHTGLKLARYSNISHTTLEVDKGIYSKGKLFSRSWVGEGFSVRYNHRTQSIIGSPSCRIKYSYGRFYIEVIEELDESKEVHTGNIIALDPGLRNFLVGFDGQDIKEFTSPDDNEKLLSRFNLISNLKKQRASTKDGELRRKITYKINRLYRKLKNLTEELHRKLSHYLATNYDLIFLPTFEVKEIFSKSKNCKSNNRLSRLLGHYKFKRTLKDYCAKYGSGVIEVSEAYSSKTCSHCHTLKFDLGGDKVFKCDNCNLTLDRDWNGAINILMDSISKLQLFGMNYLLNQAL